MYGRGKFDLLRKKLGLVRCSLNKNIFPGAHGLAYPADLLLGRRGRQAPGLDVGPVARHQLRRQTDDAIGLGLIWSRCG